MRLAESVRQLATAPGADDAYLVRQRNGGKAGRGLENKVPFVEAVQTTEDGRPERVHDREVTGVLMLARLHEVGILTAVDDQA